MAKVTAAVRAARKRPGGSNVGKARKTSAAGQGPFCGPAGGAPAGSFPVTSCGQGKSAIGYSHNAPNPAGVKACARRIMKQKGCGKGKK